MALEFLKEQLKEFNYYKNLILRGEAGKRNIIVERKDGTCAVIHNSVKEFPIPGMDVTIDQIERITVFLNGKEYEFVACQ